MLRLGESWGGSKKCCLNLGDDIGVDKVQVLALADVRYH